MSVFQKILRAGEGRTLKRLHERVHEINVLEDEIAALSDDALRAKTEEFRDRFDQGEDLDDLLPEAFARVRESGAEYWADPEHRRPRETNTMNGGQGVYFADPDGHNLELLTRA